MFHHSFLLPEGICGKAGPYGGDQFSIFKRQVSGFDHASYRFGLHRIHILTPSRFHLFQFEFHITPVGLGWKAYFPF